MQEQSSCNHEEELKATAARQFRVESRQKGKGEAINIRGDGDSRKACEMKPLQSQKQFRRKNPSDSGRTTDAFERGRSRCLVPM